MHKQQPQDNRFEQMNDYEQPTEPMSQVILSPYSSTIPVPESSIDEKDLPAPRLDERPFPKQRANPVDAFHEPPAPPMYPVLPPVPAQSFKGRPPGGALPGIPPRVADKPAPRKPHRSSFPVLVGFFFVIVEILLLLRLLFLLSGTQDNNVWVGLVNTLSGIFVLPFRMLLENVKIPLLYGSELYNDLLIVVALLMYVILSRILVRFLKAVLY
jgi:hypothetical protein